MTQQNLEIEKKNLKQANQVNSITTEIPLEQIAAQFLNKKFIKPPTYTLYRNDINGQRHYVRHDDLGKLVFFGSVTTVTGAYEKLHPRIIKWQIEKCVKEGDSEKALIEFINAGEYGTLAHIVFTEIIRGEDVDLLDESLKIRIDDFLEKAEWEIPLRLKKQWIRRIRKDAVGFVQWCQKYEPEVIASEIPLASDELGYAGTMDLVAYINYFWKEQDPENKRKKIVKQKRVLALIDYKSGLTHIAFREGYAKQLTGYKNLWEDCYPDFVIEKMFIYQCKDYQIDADTDKYYFDEYIESAEWYDFLKMFLRKQQPVEFKPTIKEVVVNRNTKLKDMIQTYEITPEEMEDES